MISVPPDPFEEFMSLPVGVQCSHPQFDVVRITDTEYERVYGCIDAAFGIRRPVAHYEWLYRQNPYGRALVWAVEDRRSGAILKTGAKFPWPIWRGNEPLQGVIGGDAATQPEWQRKGLASIRREVVRSHPFYNELCDISGPNANSRAAMIHRGDGDSILGRLKGGVIVLRALPARSKVPASLVTVANAVVDRVQAGYRWITLPRTSSASFDFTTLDRFTAPFDELTLATMAFPGYWSPHSWQFLNWRYLDHPVESYSAFVLREDGNPVGYGVLRFAGNQATLSEFAVDARSTHRSSALLKGLIDVARQAGCSFLTFFGTPAWRHWGLFHRAGMVPWLTNNYLEVEYNKDIVGSRDIGNWQLMPGDRDYH
ncbi:MAG: hypothetical protein R3E82_15725 [Pseudomonadales bacterium]